MAAPAAPDSVQTPEELVQAVQTHPHQWWDFLSGAEGTRNALREALEVSHQENDNLRTQIENLQIQNEQLRGIRNYQDEKLKAAEEQLISIRVRLAEVTAKSNTSPAAPTPVPTPAAPTVDPLNAPVHSTSPPPASRSERLPDPDKFDGDRKDLRRFIAQVHTKMLLNRDRYPTAAARMGYVTGRLTGIPYKQVLPYITNGLCSLPDYDDILQLLENTYGDPNRIQNAQKELFALRQRDSEFGTFFAEFQRLALESNLSEESLPVILERAISRELQEMLLHNPSQSRDYHALARHLQELENRRRYYEATIASRRRPAATQNPTATKPDTTGKPATPPFGSRPAGPPFGSRPAAPPFGTRPAGPLSSSRPGTPPVPSGEPMDLSRQQRSKQYEGRFERRECFRCGSPDHYVAACPFPDNRPPHMDTYHPRTSTRSPSPPRYSRMLTRSSSPGSPRSSRPVSPPHPTSRSPPSENTQSR